MPQLDGTGDDDLLEKISQHQTQSSSIQNFLIQNGSSIHNVQNGLTMQNGLAGPNGLSVQKGLAHCKVDLYFVMDY